MRALELAPDLADAHAAAAMVAIWCDRDLDTASSAFAEALRLAPQHTVARANHALWLLAAGRRDYDAALAEADRLVVSDPLSSYAWAMLSIVRFSCGRAVDSITPAERSVALDRTSMIGHIALVTSLRFSGRVAEARAAVGEALAASGRLPYALGTLSLIDGQLGDVARARAVYDELTARARHEYVQHSDLAAAALGASRIDDALTHLESALGEREPRVVVVDMEYWPDWHVLRGNPRYDEVVSRVRAGR